MDQKIAFIGAGNMAGALIGGLLADEVPAENLIAADPSQTGRGLGAALMKHALQICDESGLPA